MVSFSCEACGDVLTKKKLDAHFNRCWNASYTCLDCMQHFQGNSYKTHTSCMTEAQKYQGHLYRDKIADNQSTAMVPIKAYVEDEADIDMTTVAAIEAPPRAPSPPSMVNSGQHTPVNVFDFMVDQSPTRPTIMKASTKNRSHKPTHKPNNSLPDGAFAYGNGPVEMLEQKFESDPARLRSMLPPTTPGVFQPPTLQTELTPIYEIREPREEKDKKDESRSSQKRKRQQVEDLDLSLARHREQYLDAPSLHSGLTGGLARLLNKSDNGPSMLVSPLSPAKRTKSSKSREGNGVETRLVVPEKGVARYSDDEIVRRHRRRHPRSHSPDGSRRPRLKAIEYRQTSLEPSTRSRHSNGSSSGSRHSHAELFISLVTKGPDSTKGQSVYTALKDFHGQVGGSTQIDYEEKQLLKGLRMKRNKRGEVVLFARSAGDESP